MFNIPLFYTIRFEGVPAFLYIGKAKPGRSREARWSEHSKSFRTKKAAPKMQAFYDMGHKVIYGRVTYSVVSLPMQTVEDMERETMAHAVEMGYKLLNVVSLKMVLERGRLDRDNADINLNTLQDLTQCLDPRDTVTVPALSVTSHLCKKCA